MIIVLTTVASDVETGSLAEKLVREKLAACVQVLPRITSVYLWEGEVRSDAEHLLLIKTLPEKYDELEAFIKANHSYTVPEIVAIPAERVSDEYLGWMNESLR